jgi:2-oxoglutarate ferredoxin oxidoreductase subunit alpha
MQTVALVLTDQNLAQSTVLIPEPEYQLPEIGNRLTAEPNENFQRYEVSESGVSAMAIPGTASSTYVADGLEHCASGKPSTAAADHLAQLDKRSRKITSFDYGEHWADVRGNGDTAILTWGSTTAAAREAGVRLRTGGHGVKVIALRLLLPASPDKLAGELEGISRVLIVEQSHSRQFHLYLRAHYDIQAMTRTLARPGPLPLTPAEIVDQIENWS